MPKPEVPTEPITLTQKPNPADASLIQSKVAALVGVKAKDLTGFDFESYEKLVADEDWPRALGWLTDVSKKALAVHNATVKQAQLINRQHWSPLLKDSDAKQTDG